MRKALRLLVACVALAALLVTPAWAITTLNFDELTGDGSLSPTYAGFEWSSNLAYFDFTYPPYNPGSPPTRIYSLDYGGWVKFHQLVDFERVWFATDGNTTILFSGKRNGVSIYEFSPLTLGFQGYVNLDFLGVDELAFGSSNPGSAVWDDFRFTAVPLPPTVWLFGTGAGGLFFWRSRRRKRV